MNPMSNRSARRGEAGSAYIIALLVLVVLTVVGLALTLITQTEVQIGATERSANRSFYASDSGPHLAAKGTLRQSYDQNLIVHLNTTAQDTGVANPASSFSDELTVTPMIAINSQPCNICDVADTTNAYKNVVHVVNSTDARTGFIGPISSPTAQSPLGDKTVGTFILLQPWKPSIFQRQYAGFDQRQPQVLMPPADSGRVS